MPIDAHLANGIKAQDLEDQRISTKGEISRFEKFVLRS